MLSHEVISRNLDGLSDRRMAAILRLSPTLADVEAAAICLAGGHDVLVKSAHHMSAIVEDIVKIVTDGEDEPKEP